MAEFINYIIDSPIQPVKTNVLWVKKGVLHYYNKKWIPIAGGGSGNITSPIIDGEGNYSAVLAYSDNKALNISSIALGYNNISRNFAEASFGKYNLSHESNDPSIATLFSIGNGSEEERKNAFEVKEDGEIYIGKRVESLQTILTNLENHPLDDKYAILEEQLQNLDVYTKENISILSSSIESNTSKIEENTTKININAIDIKSINDYLKELKEHIDVSDSELESTFEKYKTDVDGALIEMSTSITQTAEEIRLEAEKTKKELDGKLTEYEASFSITAEEIRAEVSRVETDVNGKIVEANSLISQTADAIRTEVSRVELDINGKITEANSRIEQTANSITSEVYEIEKTLDGRIKENKSSIEQTSEKIESTVESLTILDNKVLNQESKINQTAESIELLVTEVETQGSKIEENTANIEINKNAITSKVEKDDFDALSSAIEETGKEFTEVKQTVSGIETTIQDQTGKVTRLEKTVTGLAVKTGTLEAEIQTLKDQSDGAIDTHFGKVAPTLDNEPAVNWDTEELKKEHTGDLYYNNSTGEAFRWSYDPETETYLWVELTDSALTDALEKISKLEVAIDGKVTIFYSEPSNYKEGDIWFVHINYPDYHFTEGQLLTATDKSETFNASHWKDKTNFASHAEVETAANNLDTYIRGAFLDQTLTVAEVAQIKESKKTFDSLIAEVEESYKYLIVSAVATESDKTKLEQAYNKLLSEETANEGSYILLVQAVNNLLALDKEEGDDIINLDEAETLLKAYEDAYNTFLIDLKAYYDATNALTENVQAHLNEASKYIENIVSDGILSPIEKKQLFDIWRQIKEEFIANRGIAVNYKIIKLNEEGNYVKNEELYNDKNYFDIYEVYLNNYLPLEGIFIGSDWGFNDLNIASPTPEGYDTEYIATSFNNYYNALTPFAEMIAEITIAITDAHDKAIALANKLQEHLDPKDEISVIGKGVILSSIIGVKKSSDDTFISAINAQALDNEDISTVDETHGRVVYAGGIPSSNNWNDSTTVIYEDGHVKFKSGEIAGDFHIGGNATIADSVSIGETRQAILNKANTLQESLGVGGNTIIDGGLVLSTLLGVVDENDNLTAALNASNGIPNTTGRNKKIVFAGGIDNNDWGNSETIIYEDGYVVFNWGKIGTSVEIADAMVHTVLENPDKINLLGFPGYNPNTGQKELIPLFQVNTEKRIDESTGEEYDAIVSISSVYDLYVNGNLVVWGDTSSTARGTDSGTDGTLIGIVVNGTRYEDETNGMLDLSTLMNQYALTTAIPSLEGYAKLTDIPSLDGYALKTEIPTTMAWTAITGKPSFASVATSGSYNDLSNKPTIPTTLPASDVYAWAKAATKPSYKTSEVAEETNLYFTNARAVSALADTLKDYVTKTALASDLGEYASKEWVNEKGYITGITLTGDDYISVNGYKLSLAIDAQGGLTNTGQGLGIYQIPSAKIVTDALGYTPLSTAGGEISGAVTTVLTINTTYGSLCQLLLQDRGANKARFGWSGDVNLSGYRYGAFLHNTTSASSIGVKDDGTPYYNNKTLYHTGNFNPANYLPLSGGTISGSGAELLKLDSSNSSYNAILFKIGGVTKSEFGFTVGSCSYIYDYTSAKYLGVDINGTPFYGAISGTGKYTLIHSGNYSSYALPKSGGTITNSSNYKLTLNATNADNYNLLGFSLNGDIKGYIGTRGEKFTITTDYEALDFNGNTVIHSGNIGSQFVEGIGTIYADQSINFGAEGKIRLIKGVASTSTSLGFPNRYTSGISVLSNYCGWQMLTYGGASINNPYFRKLNDNGVWSDWKTIAFTDSNVASATKLTTARTLWGQSFDGTGNVSGDFYLGTGYIRSNSGHAVFIANTYTHIGYGSSANGYDTYIDGNNIYLRYGTSHATAMTINSSGNVLIGTTTDSGTKVRVEGKVFINRYVGEGYTGGADLIINKAGTYYFGIGSATSDNTKFVIGRLTSVTGDWSRGDIIIADNGAVTISGQTTINNNLVVAGDTSSGSDIRFKDKITDHRIALSDIAEAPLFTFRWNDREDDSVHLGSSAQYWEKVAPWLVKGEDFKTLDYSTLGVAIGISLANKTINLEDRVKILEKENKALKEQIRRIQYGS